MYSKEELEAARRTDMVTFLESHEGFSFKSSGGWYIGIEHDSLKINPDRYTWHWYSRDLFGKGAIDWLCKVDGYGFRDAVSRLIGDSCSIRASPDLKANEQHYPKKDKKPKAELTPPQPMQGKCRELYAYLNITRKLPADIISYCVSNKLIYLDVKKRAIFCGYDKTGKMRFAEAKITNAVPDSNPSSMMSLAGADLSGNFTYDSKTNITAASDESWTVTISSKNYTDITATLTFSPVDKTNAGVSINDVPTT